jgi:hypothetical protein
MMAPGFGAPQAGGWRRGFAQARESKGPGRTGCRPLVPDRCHHRRTAPHESETDQADDGPQAMRHGSMLAGGDVSA